MIKSNINCSENRCCDHIQKYKKLECLCWEEGGELGWVFGCSLGEESWDGEEEGEEEWEIEEERVGIVGIYRLLPMESLTDTSRR